MALDAFYYDNRWAVAWNTSFSEVATINLAASYVRATVALQNVSDAGEVGVRIIEYVQNGTPHWGSWQEIAGPGISSVTYSLDVNNAYGQASLNIDIFN